MSVRESSKLAFEDILASGDLGRLQQMVYAAICEIGPVHNRLLLEYLQENELSKPPREQIAWRDSYFPRLTELVDAGHVVRGGVYRVWHNGKKLKARHVWYVPSANSKVPAAWEKVEKKLLPRSPPPKKALQAVVSSASQAGRILAGCRHKKIRTKQTQRLLF